MARSDYLLADGSPRYGIRTEEPVAVQTVSAGPAVNSTISEAAAMPAVALELAIRIRRTRPWLHKPDKLTQELLDEYPEEAREALDLLTKRAGTTYEWADRALKEEVEDLLSEDFGRLSYETQTMLGSGGLKMIPVLAFMVMVAMGINPWIALPITIALRFLCRMAADLFEGSRRMVVTSALTEVDLSDLALDVQTAALVDILTARGVTVHPAAASAARAGFKDMQRAARAVRSLNYPG